MASDETLPEPLLRLLEQYRVRIRNKHYSLRTEQAYTSWVRQFVQFNGGRPPQELGTAEVQAFLAYLTSTRHVSPSTHQQALSALLFLYREILGDQRPWLDALDRPKKPLRLPVVLTAEEVQRVLAAMRGTHRLMARLLYGTGMRLMECTRLRVRDLDFTAGEVTVRNAAGDKDRVTILPDNLVEPLQEYLRGVRRVFDADRAADRPGVYLPEAVERRQPSAGRTWPWFWVFPARRPTLDPASGVERRPHTHEQALQRAVKRAVVQTGIGKPATTHALRHAFAVHLLQSGYDIRMVQALLGHSDPAATAIYLQVLGHGA